MANNEEQNDHNYHYGQVVVAYDGYEKGATYSYDRRHGCCWYGHTGRNANIKVHLMLGAKLTEIATKQGHYISRYPLNRPTSSVTKRKKNKNKEE